MWELERKKKVLTDFLKTIKELTWARKQVMDLLGCVFLTSSVKTEEKQRLSSDWVCRKELVRESIVNFWEDIDGCIPSMALCQPACSEDLYLVTFII